MSVDYYGCKKCGDGVYEEYIGYCCDCGERVGTCCVVNDDKNDRYIYEYGLKCDGTKEQADKYGFDLEEYEIGEKIDDAGFDSKYCPFCSGGAVNDEMLLNHALALLNMTTEELTENYRNR